MKLKIVFAAALSTLALHGCKEPEGPRHPIYRSTTTIYPPAQTIDGVAVKKSDTFNEKTVQKEAAKILVKNEICVDNLQACEDTVLPPKKPDTLAASVDTLRIKTDSLSTGM